MNETQNQVLRMVKTTKTSETPQIYSSDEYKKGFIDGLIAYAWWKDGEQYVGTTGTTLKEAIEDVEKTWNYSPKS